MICYYASYVALDEQQLLLDECFDLWSCQESPDMLLSFMSARLT